MRIVIEETHEHRAALQVLVRWAWLPGSGCCWALAADGSSLLAESGSCCLHALFPLLILLSAHCSYYCLLAKFTPGALFTAHLDLPCSKVLDAERHDDAVEGEVDQDWSQHSLPAQTARVTCSQHDLPCSKVLDAERERQGHDEADEEEVDPDWSQHPEDAAASVVHHSSILRNKRLLLIYTCACHAYSSAQRIVTDN